MFIIKKSSIGKKMIIGGKNISAKHVQNIIAVRDYSIVHSKRITSGVTTTFNRKESTNANKNTASTTNYNNAKSNGVGKYGYGGSSNSLKAEPVNYGVPGFDLDGSFYSDYKKNSTPIRNSSPIYSPNRPFSSQVSKNSSSLSNNNNSNQNTTGIQSELNSADSTKNDASSNETNLFPTSNSFSEDWSQSFAGFSTEPFSKEISDVLLRPINELDVEVKPDGILYLPEIKYRRILNAAFGPGGWGLAPRSGTAVTGKTVSREYALVCHGRLVSIARGEQDFFDPKGIATATEGCKSNALMRTCKDLGIASELWDPAFITKFKAKHCVQEFVETISSGKKAKLWRRKDRSWAYPYKPAQFTQSQYPSQSQYKK